MTAREVRARIASMVLGERPRAARTRGSGPDLGGFTLRPAQRRALREVRAAIAEFGGGLLADPPGTGKTVLALAAARGAARVLVLGPSAVRAQWLAAAERAGVPIVFMSHEALSRGGAQRGADFVIVDEAHHLRTVTARRYANAAAACMGAKVLLLSATPVVNRAADRDALLALFMGSRAERLTATELGRCVVRRREPSEDRPHVRRLGPIEAQVEIDGIGAALRQLPPPVPLTGDATATALIVMSLAMAWQSSLAALDAALRRRVQRGGALGDLLRAGCMPSRAALRHWVLHDDATQLALPLVVAPAPALPGSPGASAMLAALERHLAAIRTLRGIIGPHRARDAAQRADAIRALLASHPDRRMIVFARHAETVRALHSALRGEPGVVAIVGARVRAAAGRWNRDQVLRAIGPGARAPEAHDPHAIRLVLSTDALAEGVEMQGVGIVLHADLPWTPARLEQRVGRVVRVGSVAREVLETWFAAPRGARTLVRLGARLARKARLRRRAVREGDARGEIAGILEEWRAAGSLRGSSGRAHPDSRRGVSAVVSADVDGFISVANERGRMQLVCAVLDGARWRVSSAPVRVLSVLRASNACDPDRAASPSPANDRCSNGSSSAMTARRARRLLVRVLARRLALEVTGTTGGGAPHSRLARRLKRTRSRLSRLLERAPALVRPVLARHHLEIMRILALPLEAAREARIDDLLRADLEDAAFARRLGALLKDRLARPATGIGSGAARDGARDGARDKARDEASAAPVLLLRRASAPPATAAVAPPTASPGSAATR